MGDYTLERLNPRDFEHMTQALALKEVAAGVTPFGDGKDGGREATYTGKMAYPSAQETWDGYLVMQCKFLQRPTGDRARDAAWALDQLQADLKKFYAGDRELPKPEYYIFVTNATLTAVQDSGSKDRTLALLKEYKEAGHLKGSDVWDYDKLCRLLDGHRDVARSYAAFLTAHDVISKVMDSLQGQRADFAQAVSVFLQREMRQDQFVRWEQAGQSTDQKTALGQVFVDLPAFGHPLSDPPSDETPTDTQQAILLPGIVSELLEAGSRVLGGAALPSNASGSHSQEGQSCDGSLGRYVIVGGPGQGKSTVGQFLCQIYRGALLSSEAPESLAREAQQLLELFQEQCAENGIELPGARRFPVRVVLESFAAELARGHVTSLLSYILKRINTLTDRDFTPDDLRRWLGGCPWLLVLDGLDEVPASSNRAQVLEKIADFWSEASGCRSDMLVVATTRPQGYGEEFSTSFYTHRYLAPLSKLRGLHYARRLMQTRYGSEPERRELVLTRLTTACERDTTARLMRSPLQVTIMATLVERVGEPPQERYRLFQQYYKVIYARETERGIPASRVLQQSEAHVNAIHQRVGLLLQAEGERQGTTESRLSAERFQALVQARLQEEGHEGKDLELRVHEITDAALQRLVFLVGLEADQVGFEIRSLQEFMAAEALMEGGEALVRDRLAEIAPVEHWRNVFLFAAGKCAVERQHLRDMLVTLCRELNLAPSADDSERASGLGEGAVAAATLAGSRLALDILQDGVQGEQPKYRRLFGECALRLLELPDEKIAARLAEVHEPALDAMFQEALRSGLQGRSFARRLGAWAPLKVLVQKDVPWAVSLADHFWPQDATEALRVLKLNDEGTVQVRDGRAHLSSVPMPSGWMPTKLVNVALRVTPSQLETLTVPHPTRPMKRYAFARAEDRRLDSRLPAWCGAIDHLFQSGAASSRLRIAVRVPESVPSTEQERENGEAALLSEEMGGVVQLELRSIYDVSFPYWQAIGEMPFQEPSWEPYVCAADFVREPTKEVLAAQLRRLARTCQPLLWKRSAFGVNLHPLALGVPWPLAACLMESREPEDLLTWAHRIEEGQLGDTRDWKTAENRWSARGIVVEDWDSLADERWPFDADVSRVGFPLACATWIRPSYDSPNLWQFLWALFEHLPHASHSSLSLDDTPTVATTRARVRFAAIVAAALALATTGDSLRYLRVEPEQLREVLSTTEEVVFNWCVLNNIALPEADRSECNNWVEFFAWLGAREAHGYVNLCPLPLAGEIAAAYEADLSRMGLLNTLGAYALTRSRFSVNKELVNPFNFVGEEQKDYRINALFTRLLQGGWDEEEAQRLAALTAELSAQWVDGEGAENQGTNVVHFAVTILHALESENDRQKFALALWRELQLRSSEGLVDALWPLHVLMRDRKSRLWDANRRAELDLPRLP